MFEPNHRYIAARHSVEANAEGVKTSDDELIILLLKEKNGEPYVDNYLSKAYQMYMRGQQSKLLMEALLLAPDSTNSQICTTMRCNEKLVEYYSHYFFDTTVFEDNFDLVDYISSITDDAEAVTKRMAVTEGFAYVVAFVTGKDLDISYKNIRRNIQTLAYKMIKQCAGSAVTSDVAKEAKSWAGILKTMTDQVASDDEQAGKFEDFFEQISFTMKKEPAPRGIDTLLPEDVTRG